MKDLKILNIRFNGINIFQDNINFDFYTNGKVVENEGTYFISNSIYTNNVISIVGLNAVGKTSLLKIIHFILEIIINNRSLNEMENVLIFSQDKFNYEVTFYYNDKYYKILSYVIREFEKNGPKIKYDNEFLLDVNKSDINSKNKLRKLIELPLNENNSNIVRNDLDSIIMKVLKEDDSIVTMVTRDNNILVRDMIDSVNINFLNVKDSVPKEVLNLFDENIDYIKKESDDPDSNLVLKFKNSDGLYSTGNIFAWGEFISSGTIKGNSLANISLEVLKIGGYLLVDEIENHLNKQLIKVFIDLFNDKNININGATIIFTTHYPEIIDFINRSDNIFVMTRNKEKKAKIELLSNIVRNDVKKSDVILSNYIKGTAPNYEQIQNFKEYIESEVNDVK